MKIRTGFVSNSSSSSFVVTFPEVPKCEDKLRQILIGDEEIYKEPWGDQTWSTRAVTTTVWHELQAQQPLTTDEVTKIIGSGYFEEHPNINDFRNTEKEFDFNWDAYHAAINTAAQKICDKFMKDTGDTKLFTFSYSDNDSKYFAALEHGKLFNRLKHLCVNHH